MIKGLKDKRINKIGKSGNPLILKSRSNFQMRLKIFKP